MSKLLLRLKFECAKLLNTLGFKDLGNRLWKEAMEVRDYSNDSRIILERYYDMPPAEYSANELIKFFNEKKIRVGVSNFWQDFNLDSGFIKYLLDLSFNDWVEVQDLASADVILMSVFPHSPSICPKKTIAFIWENVRPDYRYYKFSLSSDFDSYSGRNIRCPLWYWEIAWSKDYKKANLSGGGAHGHEPLIPLETLMKPRTSLHKRAKFCSFVGWNPEPHRMMTIEALNKIDTVSIYGPISGKIEKRSKYKILADYNFNLCFENSMFPGYYTEKLLQAWVAGAVPLYFSDPKIELDFNTKCFINKAQFQSMGDFIKEVFEVYHNTEKLSHILSEPLITQEPTLEPIVEFLRKSVFTILQKNK